jgi:hypothetical protein
MAFCTAFLAISAISEHEQCQLMKLIITTLEVHKKACFFRLSMMRRNGYRTRHLQWLTSLKFEMWTSGNVAPSVDAVMVGKRLFPSINRSKHGFCSLMELNR